MKNFQKRKKNYYQKYDRRKRNTWIVPRHEGETKIECVYDGQIKERSEELKSLIEEINEKVDILSKSGSFDDFKIHIRDWRISNLFK